MMATVFTGEKTQSFNVEPVPAYMVQIYKTSDPQNKQVLYNGDSRVIADIIWNTILAAYRMTILYESVSVEFVVTGYTKILRYYGTNINSKN